ncbi:MAG: YgjV family protein [Candidatus Gracilibacteria bacterium]|nr:YgjV family protein [Candidatus Gracilibacteria bacterium]
MQEIINNIIEIFNANPVGQILGIMSFLIQIIALSNKDDKKFIYLQIFALVFWIGHYYFMGLFITAVISFINIGRGIVALRYPRNFKLFILFAVIYGINAILNYQNTGSILAIIACFTALYSFFYLSGKGIIFRCGLLFTSTLWLSYHFYNQSIGGVMTETLMISINLITIFRLYRDKINLKNNLNLKLEPELVEINKN